MNSEITIWQAPLQTLTLGSAELHLWRLNLNCNQHYLAKSKSLLSQDELNRADRLLDPQKSSQFIVSRAGVRTILGQYLATDPQQIFFQYNQSGKPALADSHCSQLSFNLSHSGQWAILAVAHDIEVGVDVEFIDTSLGYRQLSAAYFNGRERESLSRYPAVRQRRGFYRLWTKQEAALKLEGAGFSRPKCTDLVDPGVSTPFLRNFFLAPGHVAAVASNKTDLAIIRTTFPVCDSVLSLADETVDS